MLIIIYVKQKPDKNEDFVDFLFQNFICLDIATCTYMQFALCLHY